jgi:hypothetical protein
LTSGSTIGNTKTIWRLTDEGSYTLPAPSSNPGLALILIDPADGYDNPAAHPGFDLTTPSGHLLGGFITAGNTHYYCQYCMTVTLVSDGTNWYFQAIE